MSIPSEWCERCRAPAHALDPKSKTCYACTKNDAVLLSVLGWLHRHVPDRPTEEQAMDLFTFAMEVVNYDIRLHRLLLAINRSTTYTNRPRFYPGGLNYAAADEINVDGW